MAAVRGAEEKLQGRFAEVAREWASITGTAGPIDEDRFTALAGEARAIMNAGLWVSGPADLLTILGRQRAELFHSRILGWLMTPTGKHGLGSTFLRRLIHQLWPEENVEAIGPVIVELEKTRSGVSAVTGENVEARADIVVSLDDLLIVIENKLDAGEQPGQCERLYWAWRDSAVASRWIYLTLSGRPPSTVFSDEARTAWRQLSYAQVAAALEDSMDETHRRDLSPGRMAAAQYLQTLVEHPR
jgi:hypothetical protein